MKNKLTKKYYVPGLMSALIIPLLFWHYGNRELQKPIPHVMDFGLPGKYNPKIPLNQQFSFENFTKFQFDLTNLPKNTVYIIFGFLILLNVSILNIKKFL